MNRDDFQKLMHAEFEKLLGTNKTKGHDYSGDDDALRNFKVQAVNAGVTPEQVWSIFAGKHWEAVQTYVREGDVQSEPVEGRIHDLILYGFLLLGLVMEKRVAEDRKRITDPLPEPITPSPGLQQS